MVFEHKFHLRLDKNPKHIIIHILTDALSIKSKFSIHSPCKDCNYFTHVNQILDVKRPFKGLNRPLIRSIYMK